MSDVINYAHAVPPCKIESPRGAFERLNASFATGVTRDLRFRAKQLRLLRNFLFSHEGEICDALWRDLRRHESVTFLAECQAILREVDFLLDNLGALAKPVVASRFLGTRTDVTPVPKGVVVVFGASNFPVALTVKPAAAAIAAGNCVVMKPSELTPASERLLLKLADVLDRRGFAVVTGGPPIAAELMTLRWDHVLFTGSTPVGRKIHAAAAKNLVPVTLELGGKNPCIIAPDADVPAAAQAVVTGKFLNAGQVCLSPDYCLVHESVFDSFCEAVIQSTRSRYGPDPKTSPLFTHVGARHKDRLRRYVKETRGEVILGGEVEEVCYDDEDDDDGDIDSDNVCAEKVYMAPTVIRFPGGWDDDEQLSGDIVLQEELFAPILVVLPVESVQKAIDLVRVRPVPFSLYVFTNDRTTADTVLQNTRSANAAVNDTVVQIESGRITAGLGESGLGGGYGLELGFKTFSHTRTILYSNPKVTSAIHNADNTNIRHKRVLRAICFATFGGRLTPPSLTPVVDAAKAALNVAFTVLKAVVIVRVLERLGVI